MTEVTIHDLFAKARACRMSGDRENAICYIREILQKDGSNAEAYNNLGLLLYESGSPELAVESYKKSISLDSGKAEVFCNCANALLSPATLAEATAYFEKALTLNSRLYEARLGLGTVKQAEGDLNAAKAIFCDCLRERPDDAVAHFRLGNIMRKWNILDLAIGCFKNACRFRQGYALALMNLGEAQQTAGEIDASERTFGDLIALEPRNHSAFSNLLISMNYNPAVSPEDVYKANIQWGGMVEGKNSQERKHQNDPDPGRPLRIGYVSSDFCNHPAASFLEPVLRNHDRTGFKIICYSQGKYSDDATERFKGYSDHWRDIAEYSDDDVLKIISRDAVDILIDCTGHMADNRLPLFSRKPAPVQITWIGYPNTTGLRSLDYRFTDEILDPPNLPELYTEKLVRLNSGFCSWMPPRSAPEPGDLPARHNGHITFGSFHNLARLNKQVITLWSRVLSALPDSRLVIFRNTLNDQVIKRLSSWFTEFGIDPRRLQFKRDVPSQGHLAEYRQIDIALDTLPWSGHTTACEALWMGVPVITLRGDRAAGRMVASVLSHAGTGDWIAETPEQYVDRACLLANDRDVLAGIRKGLRERIRSSALCDGVACAREAEKAMRAMWVTWCNSRNKI